VIGEARAPISRRRRVHELGKAGLGRSPCTLSAPEARSRSRAKPVHGLDRLGRALNLFSNYIAG
jgi:hypothetical protein